MTEAYERSRAIVLAILDKDERLTRKAGSFLGQCAVDPSPLTDKQDAWLMQLSERAGIQYEGEPDHG